MPEKQPERMSREKIEALRERLYARDTAKRESKDTPQSSDGGESVSQQRYQRKMEQPRRTATPEPLKSQTPEQPSPHQGEERSNHAVYSNSMQKRRSPRSYRVKILIVGFLFFIVALSLSSLFLFFGNNTISGENISIGITGPFAVGGGEEMPLQIAISNQNAVPIESATLIIEYPVGTQSSEEPGQELFQDRRQLEAIQPGEVINIPTKALIFGEENAEKVIKVSIEYRVRGSNATFYKEADPLRFKISSSPVVLIVDSVKSITSGQETEIKLTIGSNSPTPLTGLLVKADYPFGFDFSESSPSPSSARDTWIIGELKPEERKTITIKGVVTGKQDEERVFMFTVGVPNERDPYTLASVFTMGDSEVTIEEPFLGINVSVNGRTDKTVTVKSAADTNVVVSFTNTLDSTIYDGNIEVELGGSALSDVTVEADNGFYDSSANTITWDFVDEESLREIAPGKSSTVSFVLIPDDTIQRTPEVLLSVTAKGKRIFEDRVPQELVSTAERTIKVESLIELTSFTLYSNGQFFNTGPIPPIAEETTELTLNFELANGSNDIADAEMTAVLPPYVDWLGNVSTGDDVSFNSSSRTMTWDVGNVDANDTEYLAVQIAVTPSLTQVDKIPTIIETQRFKATDRFTNSVVRAEAPALTTALPEDDDVEDQSGRVKESDS